MNDVTDEELDKHIQSLETELQNALKKIEGQNGGEIDLRGWSGSLQHYIRYKTPLDVALQFKKAREDKRFLEISEKNAISIKKATWFTVGIMMFMAFIAVMNLIVTIVKKG
jgi:hypothetical protein